MTGRDDTPWAGGPGGEPADLAAVEADDALVDRIAVESPSDAELARELVEWRRTVRARPEPDLVDVDTALGVIRSSAHRRHRSREAVELVLVLLAGLVIIACMVGIAARSAEPGSSLCPVAQWLYDQPATCQIN